MGEPNPLILDAEQEDIRLDENLVQILKPHQRDGVAFMWNALFKENHGCILAHCMGLGKTLQVVCMIHTYMSKIKSTAKILIVCPIIVINNWENEIQEWTRRCANNREIPVEKMQSYLSDRDINVMKKHWRNDNVGGVFICGYDKLCNLMKADESTFNGCDLLVCDEGHTLKNPTSARSKMVNKIRTSHRIILSGTPLQNNLAEYYQMMKFVKSDVWCTLFDGESEEVAFRLFNDIFQRPMTVGQFLDSTQEQFRQMINRSYVLNDMVKPYIHRRNGLNLVGMPEKNECVLFVCLSDIQKRLYAKFLDLVEDERNQQINRSRSKVFRDKNVLTLICNHPKALSKEENIDGTHNELIDTNSASTRNNFGEWWRDCCTSDELNEMTASNKMKLLFSILEECELSNEKVLVFSYSLATLDTIEYFLEERNKLRNRYYYRLDGETKVEKRNDDIRSFSMNNTSRLYLISTTAGGVGINLISANRVIIFDLSWNPSLEVQSIYRIYRIGQERTCKIYRFVTAGTMEEKIYNRQIAKLDLAERIVDQQQIDPHLNSADLNELYEDNSNVAPGDFTQQNHQNQFFVGQLNMNIVEQYKDSDRLLNNNLDDILTIQQKARAYKDYRAAIDILTN